MPKKYFSAKRSCKFGALVAVFLIMTAAVVQLSTSYLSHAVTDGWQTKASMATARSSTHAGVINGKLYVAGGNGPSGAGVQNALEMYDPDSNSWSAKAAMTHPAYGGTMGVINNKLYLAGGWNWPLSGIPQNTLKIYDPASNTWSLGANMPILSGCSASGVVSGKLYVLTACDGYSGFRKKLHMYDPASNTWTEKAEAPRIHVDATGGVINGKFYVAGGSDGNSASSYVDVYDPASNTWSSVASMSKRRMMAAGGVSDGRFYVVGGNDGNSALNSVEIYDPATNTWTLSGSMSTARFALAVGVINGKIYAIGGSDGSRPLTVLEVLGEGTGTDGGGTGTDSGGTGTDIDPETQRQIEEAARRFEEKSVRLIQDIESARNQGYDTTPLVSLAERLNQINSRQPVEGDVQGFWRWMDELNSALDGMSNELAAIISRGLPNICPETIEPVCGANGVTYNNACKAQQAGVQTVGAGECIDEATQREMEAEGARLQDKLQKLSQEIDQAKKEGLDVSSLEKPFQDISQFLENEAQKIKYIDDFWRMMQEANTMLTDVRKKFEAIKETAKGPDTEDQAKMKEGLAEIDNGMRGLTAMFEWFSGQGVDLSVLDNIIGKIAQKYTEAEKYLSLEDENSFWKAIEEAKNIINNELFTEFGKALENSELGKYYNKVDGLLKEVHKEAERLKADNLAIPTVYEKIQNTEKKLSTAFSEFRFQDVQPLVDSLEPLLEEFWEKAGEPGAGYEEDVKTVFNKKNPFPDTDAASLEGKAAAYLYANAVIGGFPDGEFKGDRPVNRAEAAKFLLLAAGIKVEDLENAGRFWDVLEGQWYVKYVMTAAQEGIIGGYSDGSFKPANTVNTAEFLKMLSISFGIEENLSHRYRDVPNDAWFAKYAGAAYKYNLFPNRSLRLRPDQPLTRYEVAVAIYQYLANR